MFQSLRLNSLIYIFHKGNNPELEIGTITNIPTLKPKYAIPPAFNLTQEMIVDLIVKVGDKTLNYNGLPAHLDIADSFSNGESVVISDSKDAMNSEIISFKKKSEDTINSVDTHKLIIQSCELILDKLNPEYALKKLQLDEIITLKSLMEDVSKTLNNLTEMIETLTKKEK